MNKEEYIKELKELLISNNIINSDQIISQYEKRFAFGLESGLKEKEIIEKLKTPEEVVEEIKNKKGNTTIFSEKKCNYKQGYNLIITTVNDNIIITSSNDNLVHVELSDIDKDDYNTIKNNSNEGVLIEFKKMRFLGLNRRKSGDITIYIPKDKAFDEVNLSTSSGDININIIKSNIFKIHSVSGDSSIDDIETNEFKVETVSGDNEINNIITEKTVINTVSGDFKIADIKSQITRIDTVSGDLTITKGELGNISFHSVNGELNVNGIQYKNMKNIIKDKFKKRGKI